MAKRQRKGVGDFMTVMIVILIIAIFGSFLFYTQFTSSRENIELIGKSTISSSARNALHSFYGIEYPVPEEDNLGFMTALRYGCAYGKGHNNKFLMSGPIPLVFNPRLYAEKYLEGKVGKNFYLTGNCSNSEQPVRYGHKPPASKDVVSTKLMFPEPGGGYNEFTLQRWVGQ